jgi:hypothetical protein
VHVNDKKVEGEKVFFLKKKSREQKILLVKNFFAESCFGAQRRISSPRVLIFSENFFTLGEELFAESPSRQRILLSTKARFSVVHVFKTIWFFMRICLRRFIKI